MTFKIFSYQEGWPENQSANHKVLAGPRRPLAGPWGTSTAGPGKSQWAGVVGDHLGSWTRSSLPISTLGFQYSNDLRGCVSRCGVNNTLAPSCHKNQVIEDPHVPKSEGCFSALSFIPGLCLKLGHSLLLETPLSLVLAGLTPPWVPLAVLVALFQSPVLAHFILPGYEIL